ncbi:MAG: hypothetical protein H6667_19750 [Ardenticatenaceae bacterium]|nr:hypothetical protein [Ardenticatenaceae bacterium]
MKQVLRKSALVGVLLIAMAAITVTNFPVSGEQLNTNDHLFELDAAAPNCRFGTVPLDTDQATKLSQIGAGWYLNFSTTAYVTAPSNIEYVPVIRLDQLKNGDIYLNSYTVSPPLTDAGLGTRIAAYPGATWIVGNEPDRGPSAGSSAQDDMQPEMYARAYHDVYQFIKARDPSAKVAIAGLVEITPGRLQYLDKVWAAYKAAYGTGMPVDVWNMHLYIMPEVTPLGVPNDIANVAVGTDPALGMRESTGRSEAYLCGNVNNDVYCFADHDNLSFFQRQIKDLRTWMKNHGQQNKPLIISEYSILYGYEAPGGVCEYLQDEFGQCFTPVRVSNYLHNTFDLIDGPAMMVDTSLGYPQDNYRLVQQAMWFSIYYNGAGKSSSLYEEDLSAMTLMGQAFQSEIAERNLLPNLIPWNAANVPGFIIAPSTTSTVTISVDVYNNGDTAVTTPTTVTFYSDQNLTTEIATAVVPNLNGCARGPVSVSVNWSNLPEGVHYYWVKVDSGAGLAEESESDNIISGLVIINPDQTYLPTALR